MDPDIEKIHNLMLDANLPSTINELKNPTAEFIVKLITAFLQRFCIDVNAIDKPTCEQQQVMTYFEDSDVTGLVNLYAVMARICDRIFVKDFCISDIIAPGPKKGRKLGKFLGNFVLYTNIKQAEIQEKIENIESRSKVLRDMQQRSDEIRAAINEKALHTSKQMAVKEKLLKDIEKVKARIEKNKQRKLELEAKINIAEGKRIDAVQRCTTRKREVLKLSKAIDTLRAETVTSPEQYKARLHELKEQRQEQIQEREMMQEAFQKKKELIAQLEKLSGFVQQQYDKFPEVKHTYNELKSVREQGENVKKRIEVLKGNASEMERHLSSKKEKCGTSELEELRLKYEENLSSLKQKRVQLLSRKKGAMVKVQEELVRQSEARLERDKIREAIVKYEDETKSLLDECQKRYDNEIAIESRLQKAWEGH